MVVHVDFPKKKVKRTRIRKGKTSKKLGAFVHEHDSGSVMRDIDAYTANDDIEYK